MASEQSRQPLSEHKSLTVRLFSELQLVWRADESRKWLWELVAQITNTILISSPPQLDFHLRLDRNPFSDAFITQFSIHEAFVGRTLTDSIARAKNCVSSSIRVGGWRGRKVISFSAEASWRNLSNLFSYFLSFFLSWRKTFPLFLPEENPPLFVLSLSAGKQNELNEHAKRLKQFKLN